MIFCLYFKHLPWLQKCICYVLEVHTAQTYLLYINFNVFLQIVAIQVEHKVVYKVEAIAHNDEWQLISELGLLQETLDAFWVVAVALTTDAFNLLDLTGLACRLFLKKPHYVWIKAM